MGGEEGSCWPERRAGNKNEWISPRPSSPRPSRYCRSGHCPWEAWRPDSPPSPSVCLPGGCLVRLPVFLLAGHTTVLTFAGLSVPPSFCSSGCPAVRLSFRRLVCSPVFLVVSLPVCLPISHLLRLTVYLLVNLSACLNVVWFVSSLACCTSFRAIGVCSQVLPSSCLSVCCPEASVR